MDVIIDLSLFPDLWMSEQVGRQKYNVEFFDDVEEWLENNDIKYKLYSDATRKLFSVTVAFKSEADAALFKIRWL